MSWCWLARVPNPPTDARAVAPLTRAGEPAGHLAVWPRGDEPVSDAVRMDARLVDRQGEPATISLLILPPDRSPLFDDTAVSHALRAVLAGPAPDAVTTFVRDSAHFAGALTVWRDPGRRCDDPFAAIGPAEILEVGAGLVGTVPPVPGPVIQRYGGAPWPVAGF